MGEGSFTWDLQSKRGGELNALTVQQKARGTFTSVSEPPPGKKLWILMGTMLIYSFNKLSTGIILCRL